MNSAARKLLVALIGVSAILVVRYDLRAQLGMPPGLPVPTTPTAQRNALNLLRSQVNSLCNATQVAPSYATGSYGLVLQQFQLLRRTFNDFRATLPPDKVAMAANDLAELGSGLDILQEGFSGYLQDVAAGRSPTAAFQTLCDDLNEAAGVWLQKLNSTADRLNLL